MPIDSPVCFLYTGSSAQNSRAQKCILLVALCRVVLVIGLTTKRFRYYLPETSEPGHTHQLALNGANPTLITLFFA